MISTCEECRDKLRSAARLETIYTTSTAVRELGLMVLAGFSSLVLWISLLSYLHVSFVLGTFGINRLVPAAVSLTGIMITFETVADRYSFTHNLAWSFHSRAPMLGVALALSGILSITFSALIS